MGKPGATFAAIIKGRRESARLSVTELARRVGVSRQTIHAWERGEAERTVGHLTRLAAALGCHPCDLLPPPDGPAPAPLPRRKGR